MIPKIAKKQQKKIGLSRILGAHWCEQYETLVVQIFSREPVLPVLAQPVALKLVERNWVFLDFDGNSDITIGIFHHGFDQFFTIFRREQMQSE